MLYADLLRRSHTEFIRSSQAPVQALSGNVFDDGGKWMQQMLKEMDPDTPHSDPDIPFNFYGAVKYALCLAAFFISAFFLFRINIYLVPLSFLSFYFVEVQFLFLFPILINKKEDPMLTSIQMTFRVGVIKAMATVIPIAAFMLLGLLDLKNPYRNWHIGSLAVLIWYHDEIKDRK